MPSISYQDITFDPWSLENLSFWKKTELVSSLKLITKGNLLSDDLGLG